MAIRDLTTLADLDEVLEIANEKPVVLFKHSTVCPVSTFADNNYRNYVAVHDDGAVLFTHLKLIEHRDVSNAIAQRTGVVHQSPQAILIVDGNAVWNASHTGITEAALGAAIEPYC